LNNRRPAADAVSFFWLFSLDYGNRIARFSRFFQIAPRARFSKFQTTDASDEKNAVSTATPFAICRD